VITTYSLD